MDAAGANVRHVPKMAKADLLSRFSILACPSSNDSASKLRAKMRRNRSWHAAGLLRAPEGFADALPPSDSLPNA
jgi:hypothetical protein